jgi:hypothetical protein
MGNNDDEPTTDEGAPAHPWRAWALRVLGRPNEVTADEVSDEGLQDEIADAFAHGELAGQKLAYERVACWIDQWTPVPSGWDSRLDYLRAGLPGWDVPAAEGGSRG